MASTNGSSELQSMSKLKESSHSVMSAFDASGDKTHLVTVNLVDSLLREPQTQNVSLQVSGISVTIPKSHSTIKKQTTSANTSHGNIKQAPTPSLDESSASSSNFRQTTFNPGSAKQGSLTRNAVQVKNQT